MIALELHFSHKLIATHISYKLSNSLKYRTFEWLVVPIEIKFSLCSRLLSIKDQLCSTNQSSGRPFHHLMKMCFHCLLMSVNVQSVSKVCPKHQLSDNYSICCQSLSRSIARLGSVLSAMSIVSLPIEGKDSDTGRHTCIYYICVYLWDCERVECHPFGRSGAQLGLRSFTRSTYFTTQSPFTHKGHKTVIEFWYWTHLNDWNHWNYWNGSETRSTPKIADGYEAP